MLLSTMSTSATCVGMPLEGSGLLVNMFNTKSASDIHSAHALQSQLQFSFRNGTPPMLLSGQQHLTRVKQSGLALFLSFNTRKPVFARACLAQSAGSTPRNPVAPNNEALPQIAEAFPRTSSGKANFTGYWIKDKIRSESMDEAIKLVKLSGIVRQARRHGGGTTQLYMVSWT